MSHQTRNLSSSFKQPIGLGSLFFSLIFSSFSFASIQSLLVLYCTQIINLPDQSSYLLYAEYTSLAFAVPVLGGYIGNRLLGYPMAVLTGMILSCVGLYLLCFNQIVYLYLGLAVFIVGNATAMANIFVLLGRLYPINDPMRDSGFTLCYTAINIGAFAAFITSGLVANSWGFQSAFLISAISMLIALFCFLSRLTLFMLPTHKKHFKRPSPAFILLGICALVLAIPFVMDILFYTEYSDKSLLLLCVAAIFLIIHMALKVQSEHRKTILAFVIIISIGVAFWALYMLAPSVLTLFVQRNVDREFAGISIPPSTFLSLNPFFIILLGSFFSALWTYLAKKDRSPSLATKFAIGLILMGCGYLVLVVGIHHASPNGYNPITWIVLSYLLQSAGELCISPISAAMVGKLIPYKYEGTMMGIWLLSVGVGGTLSGYLAEATTNPKHVINPLITNIIYAHSFLRFGLITITVGIIAGLLASQVRLLQGTAQ